MPGPSSEQLTMKETTIDDLNAEVMAKWNSPNRGLRPVDGTANQNAPSQGFTPTWKKIYNEFQAKLLVKQKL